MIGKQIRSRRVESFGKYGEADLSLRFCRLAVRPLPSSSAIPTKKVVSMKTERTAWSKKTFLAAQVRLVRRVRVAPFMANLQPGMCLSNFT